MSARERARDQYEARIEELRKSSEPMGWRPLAATFLVLVSGVVAGGLYDANRATAALIVTLGATIVTIRLDRRGIWIASGAWAVALFFAGVIWLAKSTDPWVGVVIFALLFLASLPLKQRWARKMTEAEAYRRFQHRRFEDIDHRPTPGAARKEGKPFAIYLRGFASGEPQPVRWIDAEGTYVPKGAKYDNAVERRIWDAHLPLTIYAAAHPTNPVIECLFSTVLLDADDWLRDLVPYLEASSLIIVDLSRGGPGLDAEVNAMMGRDWGVKMWIIYDDRRIRKRPDHRQLLAAARWATPIETTVVRRVDDMDREYDDIEWTINPPPGIGEQISATKNAPTLPSGRITPESEHRS